MFGVSVSDSLTVYIKIEVIRWGGGGNHLECKDKEFTLCGCSVEQLFITLMAS